jgi:Leucine-rich repeat (LRR) protein
MKILGLVFFIFSLGGSDLRAQENCYSNIEFEVGDTATYKQRLFPLFSCDSLKSLTIKITSNKGWVVFPSVQGIDSRVRYSTKTKLGSVPEELGYLKRLEYLDLSDLGISHLPVSLVNLSNLKSLDMSFNRINVSRDIEKILFLSNLKTLKIYGCDFNEDDLLRIKRNRPDIRVLYSMDHLVQEAKDKQKVKDSK